MSSCPGDGTLLLLGTDALGEATCASIEQHVEGCPECKTVLERLARRRCGPAVALPGPERRPRIPGFEIQSELDRGGMSVVYLANETGLDRLVVLKILPGTHGPDASTDPRRRWLREARAISSVRHPNIVPLFDYGEADGFFYLVLEYVPGGTLKRRQAEPLPPRAAAELMETIASAVGYIHGRGLLHLDLKPSNILLDGEENSPWDRLTPRISDFGLALSNEATGASEMSLAGIRGTPSYMAPEQAAVSRAGVGAAADIHALGAILYELLTGRPPFQGISTLETLDQVRGQNPVPPRRLNPKIPRDLETIALKCLEKHPSRRYASADALAGDLHRWLDGFSIRARPVSTIEHAWRWCLRRPGFAALLAVFTLTVTLSLLGLFLLWRQSENALARAVGSDKAASVAIRDLVGLLTETADSPQLLASERAEKASHVVRDLMVKLRRDQGFSALNVVAICDVTRVLSWDFLGRGNHSESRVLLEETLKFLEEMKDRTDDPHVEEQYGNTLVELGRVAHNEGHIDEALVYFWRAEKVLSGMVHDPRDLKAIVMIDSLRRTIAARLDRGGQVETRRRLMESHIQMLDRLNNYPGADPSIGLLAELARSNLAPDAGACITLRGRLGRFSAAAQLSQPIQQRLVEWILSDIDQYPSDSDARGTPIDRLEPDAHADALIRAIESRCEAIGTSPAVFPAVVCDVAMAATYRSAAQRRAGRLDDARRTAARLSAFARKVVRRNPDEAKFHIVMSEAFSQEAKIGWQVDDCVVIEAAWRKALEEAVTALRLDPSNFDTRNRIANLQEKLVKLAAGRPLSP